MPAPDGSHCTTAHGHGPTSLRCELAARTSLFLAAGGPLDEPAGGMAVFVSDSDVNRRSVREISNACDAHASQA